MNSIINLYLAAEEKAGGLFDFDATVVVIGLQTCNYFINLKVDFI